MLHIKIRTRVHTDHLADKTHFWNPRLSGFIGISERQVGWILYRHRKKMKKINQWGMFLLWYYSFETRTQSVWEDTPIGEKRREGICPFEDVKKQVYCVCSFVKQSMRSRLLPAATKNCQQIEPLKKKCVQNFKALHSLQGVQLSLKWDQQWNGICRWFDRWMRKSTDLETQIKRVPSRKKKKKSTTRDGLDD